MIKQTFSSMKLLLFNNQIDTEITSFFMNNSGYNYSVLNSFLLALFNLQNRLSFRVIFRNAMEENYIEKDYG